MKVASSPANTRFEDLVQSGGGGGIRAKPALEVPTTSSVTATRLEAPLNLQSVRTARAKRYQVKELLEMIECEHLWGW